jgi:ABC-type nitrate/sulfonate/bicarbonate transport system substrate-binding protein
LFASTEALLGKYQHSYIFATNSLIKNNPEAIRGVLKAHKEAANTPPPIRKS